MTTARGMALKAAGQNRMLCRDKAWITEMRRRAKAISLSIGYVTTDALRRVVQEGEMKPPSKPQAWGTILKGNNWVWMKSEPSTFVTNHGRWIQVYRWIE